LTFKRARTQEQFQERKDRIVSIALDLYDRDGYAAVTFSTISKITSITRPALYSYFKNPDDILLYALGRDFIELNGYLESELDRHATIDESSFAEILYKGISASPRMLKMLSINYAVIEIGSSDEKLIEFKSYIMKTFDILGKYVEKFFPHVNEQRKVNFEFIIFSFISSVYILTHPSEKQIMAIAKNSTSFKVPSYEDLCYEGLLDIITALNKR